MSIAYNIKVHNQAGTLQATYTASSQIGELSQFDVDPLGICGDATFTVLPSVVSFAPRDIVLVEVSVDGGAFERLYLGMVVQAPNGRSDEVGQVRCVGLKQRFYEIGIEDVELPGKDVAAMFADAVAGINLPAQAGGLVTFATGTGPTAGAPTLGFQLGDRYPKFESFGDFADAIAETVGSFIVPSSSSYTYAGRTFTAGEIVPAVRWGVNAAGQLVFRRPVAAAIALTEGAIGLDIDWIGLQAEEFTNSVDLLYGTAFDLRLVESSRITGPPQVDTQYAPDPIPVRRRFDASGVTNATRATKRVVVPDPLAIMTQTPSLGLDTGGTSWTNLANAVDDNPSTSALSAGPAFLQVIDTPVTTSTTVAGAGFGQGILTVRYAALDPVGFEIELVTGILAGSVILRGTLPATESLLLPETAGLLIALPKEIGFEGVTPWALQSTLSLFTSGDLEVYSIQAFAPDVDRGNTRDREYAESFFTPPFTSNASVVRRAGIQPFANEVNINSFTGTVIAPVERTSYSITTSRGAETTYFVDQAFDAAEESQRVLLQRLAQRAVKDEGSRR